MVVAADFLTSAQECHYVFRRARAQAAERLRRRLLRQARSLRPRIQRPATRRGGRRAGAPA